MLYYIANPRDTMGNGNACGCCCEMFRMTPGETNLLEINYTAWSIQMAARGLTVNTKFDLVLLSPLPADDLLRVVPAEAATAAGVVLTGDLISSATGPLGATLQWFPLPLYGPNNGTFVLALDGSYTYTPHSGFVGTDVIYYEVSDGFNKVTGSLAVAVGSVPEQLTHAPAPLFVETSRRRIEHNPDLLKVPITASPDAVQGNVYRLTVRQEAMDCDGGKFHHMSCYDIVIGKC
jgi:hypothetical protein